MRLNDEPLITPDHIDRRIDGGYQVRALCLVDGFPAEVEITLDADNRRYSSADISVFYDADSCWHTVYRAPKNWLSDLPVLPDSENGLAILNRLAIQLHKAGHYIVGTARVRQDHVEAEAEALKQSYVADMYQRRAVAERNAEVMRRNAPIVTQEKAGDAASVPSTEAMNDIKQKAEEIA